MKRNFYELIGNGLSVRDAEELSKVQREIASGKMPIHGAVTRTIDKSMIGNGIKRNTKKGGKVAVRASEYAQAYRQEFGKAPSSAEIDAFIKAQKEDFDVEEHSWWEKVKTAGDLELRKVTIDQFIHTLETTQDPERIPDHIYDFVLKSYQKHKGRQPTDKELIEGAIRAFKVFRGVEA